MLNKGINFRNATSLVIPHMEPSQVVVLAGAGVSIEEPSGIPAACGLLDALLKWVAPDGNLRAGLARRMTPGSHFNPYHFLRFEGFIQAVAELDPNVFYYLESTQSYGGPNRNHCLLARMALGGATVLTTNFDTRIEQAAGVSFLPTFVLSSRRRVPGPGERLIKVHGSFPWKRGRNVTPRASLTQIGKLGLGFERFTAFRDWFGAVTAGKTLVVVGYSASDSFDVVPLLEGYSRAATVVWFSYQHARRGLRVAVVRARKSRTPFPCERTADFPGHTLARMAARSDGPCELYRVYGTDVASFLKRIIHLPDDEGPATKHGERAGPLNLSALRATLSQNPLTSSQRRQILRILDEGMFGEAYATAEEMKPARRGDRVAFTGSTARFARGTAERRANNAFRQGDPDLAFRILEESARQSADRDQLLLLLHHFEFRLWERGGDTRRLARAAAKADRVSRRGGLLWGLVMTEWMKSFSLEVEWRAANSEPVRTAELSREILTHAERAVYYGVRAGWQEWFAAAGRLAAKHSVILGDLNRGASLLKNLVTWLDGETPEGAEEAAATACALNTLGIQVGRQELSKAARKILSALDADVCPVVKLLRVAAEAEAAHAGRRWKRFARLEQTADEYIQELDPADQWGVRAVFDYLRH
jgi:hypothetical protein